MQNQSASSLAFRIEGIQPILSAASMKASREFYLGILGFSEADWGTDQFTSIHRDGASLYLCQGYQGQRGTWLWIGFDGDIDLLHDKLKEKGVKILLPPANYPWAREMHIMDPDGHVLRLGTDPDTTKPFEAVHWPHA